MLLSKPNLSFAAVYAELLVELLKGPTEVNRRTGKAIRFVPGGAAFKISLEDGLLPVAGNRRLYPQTAAAEVAWFLSGMKSIDWLNKHTKIWDLFAETDPDGGRYVDNGYGYRWRDHFGRDQLRLAVDTLCKDPSDRRTYISAWDPARDGLGEPSKNVPCPLGFTLSLQQVEPDDEDGPAEYAMHSSLHIRSSDVFVGLPYDVMGHAVLMDALCASMCIPTRPGTMTVTLAHPHLYEVHARMAQESLFGSCKPFGPPMLGMFTLKNIEDKPDEFVAAYRKRGDEAQWPEYKCKPELVL